MPAVKTNERPGTRARASYVRRSAYKVRQVLDQVRGKSCAEAREILAFSERDAARPIAKVLESAVANAEHNDGLDGDELYVSACYADEGPTLKRWRPRARGRATRINKRTCHITVIVSRYDPETLDEIRARTARGGVRTSEARRRRVARSRAAAAVERPDTEEGPDAASGGDVVASDAESDADVGARAADVVRGAEEALAESSDRTRDEGSGESDSSDSSDKSEAGS